MNTYHIRITDNADLVDSRIICSCSLLKAVKYAHAIIDSIWYDKDVNDTGRLTITLLSTGETVWIENITPFEE